MAKCAPGKVHSNVKAVSAGDPISGVFLTAALKHTETSEDSVASKQECAVLVAELLQLLRRETVSSEPDFLEGVVPFKGLQEGSGPKEGDAIVGQLEDFQMGISLHPFSERTHAFIQELVLLQAEFFQGHVLLQHQCQSLSTHRANVVSYQAEPLQVLVIPQGFSQGLGTLVTHFVTPEPQELQGDVASESLSQHLGTRRSEVVIAQP